jgi:flagellar motor switch/type III secretory pathway protein FliN
MATRALRRWGARFVGEAEVERTAGKLLGARVEVLVRSVRHAKSGRSKARPARGEADVGVILSSDRGTLSNAVLIEFEGALAATLVARALHRESPRVFDPAARASSAMAGALGAIAAAVARGAHARHPLHVLAAGPAATLARDMAASAGDLIEGTLAVLVDDDAYLARVVCPRNAATALGPPPWTAAGLAALGEMPLAVPVVAAVTISHAADVGSLRRGDVWLPGDRRLARTASGTLAGAVLLAVPTHEVGFLADLGEDGGIVLRGGLESLAWKAEGGDGVSDVEKDALVDAIGEVPVVVRVEIGSAEMRAKEWAALGPGDVILLGRRIGEGVTLRVGGVTIARGELVDVEGEVGVRILGRTEEQ